ncbi:TlpA disulfide reductase family protein [Aquabacterium sp.]|uniref:TlpA disulfide reductase family protein n=1 Tax=Aquabacterium sp. TaxID=1872578 RepID=UPI0025C6248F|nr:TlpA disulfide reductase family protein [Aquabacterium sp.]
MSSLPCVPRRRAVSVLATVALSWGLTACFGDSQPTLPDQPFTQLDGSTHRTSELKGKVTLINFWATSCSTCVREMPALVATHQRFKAQGLETLAVAMEYDPPAYVMQFAQTRQLPFRVAMDHGGQLASAFGPVQLTPTTLVLNKRGEVVKRYVGEPDFKGLHSLIEKLLAEPAA